MRLHLFIILNTFTYPPPHPQVEERKRAIWEASVSRREALLQREREREERMERSRAQRSSPRSAYVFGSSTPRLLEPVDTTGFFWAARRLVYERLASNTPKKKYDMILVVSSVHNGSSWAITATQSYTYSCIALSCSACHHGSLCRKPLEA